MAKRDNDSIFEYDSYKRYLTAISGSHLQRNGQKKILSEAMGVQSTYLSQVLHGPANLNLEQAEKLTKFLVLTQDEKHYFLLLVQFERAGTTDLRKYYENQMQDSRQRHYQLQGRLGKREEISDEFKAKYYSSWIYGAVHAALSIPHLQEFEALRSHFNLDENVLMEVIEFLIELGMAKKIGTTLATGPSHIHLGHHNHNILRHHTNFRLQAIRSLEKESSTEFHYSAIYTLSEKDRFKIKDILLEAVRTNVDIVKNSKEATLCCLTMDWFELKSS